MDKETILQKSAGYLVLLLVAVLLLIGIRLGVDAEEGAQAQADGSTPIPRSTAVAFHEETGAEGQPIGAQDVPIPVIADNAIAPAPIPRTYEGKRPYHEFETYRVERGDTPSEIAYQYGIKTETLLGGNPTLSQESSLMQPGMDLIILPFDGVLHDVQQGDTLESLSADYGIPVEDITAYEPNNLEFPYRLYPETQIIVPGAVAEVFVWTPPQLSSVSGGTSREGSGVAPAIRGTGTFVYPVSSRNFTQKFWYGHPGIDIALPVGSGVFASDTGTVTFANWNIYGYGNLIVINHGNGYETFYGHLSAINVFPGQIVYQGNVIGAVGNTGNSSGPHIHFEIRTGGNQDDPCWYIGC